jgi:hypothetical protein
MPYHFQWLKHELRLRLSAVRSELSVLWPFIAIWMIFFVWRTIAVKGIGGYGANVHLRAGWFLIDNAWSFVRFLTLPLANTSLGSELFSTVTASTASGLIGLLVLCLLLWPVRWMAGLTFILAVPVLNIPSVYRGYLAGIGYALILAFLASRLLGTRKSKAKYAVSAILTCALFGWHMIGAFERNAAWTASSRFVAQTLSEVQQLEPVPANSTHFFFANLPALQQGTYAFTWGLREGIQALYNNRTLEAYCVTAHPDVDLIKYKLEIAVDAIPPDQPTAPHVYLAYDDGVLYRVSRAEFQRRVTRGVSTRRWW